MSGIRFFVSVVLLLTVANILKADNAKSEEADYVGNLRQQETLTNGFFGFGDSLTESDIEMGLDVTHIYQQNVRGGISKHRRAGRYSGSYDLELFADLHKLPGFGSGSLFLHLEGGWPDTEGIDEPSVGSYFGVNADAIGNDAILVKQLYYEGPILVDNLIFMIGKIDFTGVFDVSAYADDECTQFLNAAFVDDPTIPFPDYSLGIALTYDLTDLWYIMGGIADAQADGRETGFRTTFSDEDYYFYALETGVTSELNSANGPMPGTHRIGLWYDPQPKVNTDYEDAGISYRDDMGFYLSCDQMLVKENADAEDSQGLGVFFRYGYANSERNDISDFWSFGFVYQGLLEGRDNDVLGIGFAQGIFSNKASATYTDDYENALELYYSVQVTPWLNISPSVQYIGNPGGDKTVGDAVVLGVRAQMAF